MPTTSIFYIIVLSCTYVFNIVFPLFEEEEKKRSSLRMKLRNTTRETFILKLKKLSAEYKDSPEFADKVLESYNQ